jgi:hypothetical protein
LISDTAMKVASRERTACNSQVHLELIKLSCVGCASRRG